MKIQLTQDDISHIRSVLTLDLKEKARKVRNCNTTTSDELLAERIALYNKTQHLINIFSQSTANDVFTDDGDNMFRDER